MTIFKPSKEQRTGWRMEALSIGATHTRQRALGALTLVLILLVFSLFGCLGCGTRDNRLLNPPTSTTSLHSDGTTPSLARYQTIYTSCGTFYLDYPSDFVGPPPPGHGRIGSTPQQLCGAQFPGDGDGTVTPQKAGDPTADEGPRR